jgi:hypothetical protein
VSDIDAALGAQLEDLGAQRAGRGLRRAVLDGVAQKGREPRAPTGEELREP